MRRLQKERLAFLYRSMPLPLLLKRAERDELYGFKVLEEREKCAERLNVIFARRGNDRSGSMRPARSVAPPPRRAPRRQLTITVRTLAVTSYDDEEGEEKRERLAGGRGNKGHRCRNMPRLNRSHRTNVQEFKIHGPSTFLPCLILVAPYL